MDWLQRLNCAPETAQDVSIFIRFQLLELGEPNAFLDVLDFCSPVP